MTDKPGFLQRGLLNLTALAALAGGAKSQEASAPSQTPSPKVSTDTVNIYNLTVAEKMQQARKDALQDAQTPTQSPAPENIETPAQENDFSTRVKVVLYPLAGVAGLAGICGLIRSRKNKQSEEPLPDCVEISPASKISRVSYSPLTRNIILTPIYPAAYNVVRDMLEASENFKKNGLWCVNSGNDIAIVAEKKHKADVLVDALRTANFITAVDAMKIEDYLKAALKQKNASGFFHAVPALEFSHSNQIASIVLSDDCSQALIVPRSRERSTLANLLNASGRLKQKGMVFSDGGDDGIVVHFNGGSTAYGLLHILHQSETITHAEVQTAKRYFDDMLTARMNRSSQSSAR